MNERPRNASRTAPIGAAFLVSSLASIALMVTYWLGGQPQVEGSLIFVALGGLSVGLILWAHELMPTGHFVEERELLPSTADDRMSAERELREGAEVVARRTFLGRALLGALGALGLAALFPVRSLGRGPGEALLHTSFRAGVRLVTKDGLPVSADTLQVGGFLTVFPEGATDAADSQTVLVRLEPGDLRPVPGRETWAPEGLVAYSKVCTHTGCPVGLYEPQARELFCPCHQSSFDVTAAAQPVAGPATRALPQLPIEIRDDGFLIAAGDFSDPVGPAFWELGDA